MNLFRKKRRRAIDKRAGKILPDVYNIMYDPAFPSALGKHFSWFQIVFAIGPGSDAEIRDQTLDLFQKLIYILSSEKVYTFSELVSIRVRRHVPESTPDHPHMFIEAVWDSNNLKDIAATQWHERAKSFVNRFDQSDPLNKGQ